MYEITENIDIKDLIYEVRGKQIMLDSDLARLYNTETKRINETVKRNLNRFPEEFCFNLNNQESKFIWSQIATKKSTYESRGGRFKNPTVFTEHGIMMLAGLLKSDTATRVNVNIIKAFVEMRKFISGNKDLFKRMIEIENDTSYIKRTLLEYDKNFEIIFDKFDREYPLLNVKYTNRFHDCFIILDDKELYHLGASLKDLGNKTFGMNKIEDKVYLESLKERINDICMK